MCSGRAAMLHRDAHPSRGPTAVSSVRARAGLAPLLDACKHAMSMVVPREVTDDALGDWEAWCVNSEMLTWATLGALTADCIPLAQTTTFGVTDGLRRAVA